MSKKFVFILVIPITVLLLGSSPASAGEAETVEVPPEIIEITEEIGGRYGICPELLQAICWKESRFIPDVENGSCKGLMQISVKWHKDRMERLGVTDIFDPYSNILVGADLLAELFREYGEAATVLMVYHGEKDAAQMAENGEISDYAGEILDFSEELEELHERREESDDRNGKTGIFGQNGRLVRRGMEHCR